MNNQSITLSIIAICHLAAITYLRSYENKRHVKFRMFTWVSTVLFPLYIFMITSEKGVVQLQDSVKYNDEAGGRIDYRPLLKLRFDFIIPIVISVVIFIFNLNETLSNPRAGFWSIIADVADLLLLLILCHILFKEGED